MKRFSTKRLILKIILKMINLNALRHIMMINTEKIKILQGKNKIMKIFIRRLKNPIFLTKRVLLFHGMMTKKKFSLKVFLITNDLILIVLFSIFLPINTI